MPIDPTTLCVLANPGSGGNRRDAGALERAMAVFGPKAELRRWAEGEDLAEVVARAVGDGFTTLVAAGGDGTVNGVAQALMGTGVALAVLPLGTFNFFARGLGLPEEAEAAAEAILGGEAHPIAIGTVNGQVFLNNASLGLYPLILKEREQVYARFGRSRLLAYWTVLSTLVRVQATKRMVIRADEQDHDLRSPLMFVARSAYQLDYYGLEGARAISADRFALFILREGSRWQMLRAVAKLALGRAKAASEIAVLEAGEMTVFTASRRPLVALDGERMHLRAPLKFRVEEGLRVVLPALKLAEKAVSGKGVSGKNVSGKNGA